MQTLHTGVRFVLLILLLPLVIDNGMAQPESGEETQCGSLRVGHQSLTVFEIPPEGLWQKIRRVFLPPEISLVYDLRRTIAAQEPLKPRSREADLRRLDAMYLHAVYLAEGDPYLALFALSFATLPYHTFPARIPLLGINITVPVSTERREAFERRLRNLPGLLLSDTPAYLDRDKIPHFFGSAWLQCVTKNRHITEAAGELLELAEELFKLEGARDERDVFVNQLGAAFGIALQKQRAVLPSDFFRMH
ncbi:MAG: hypothetical protein KFH87_13560 [Bacteroidetes bacterium]|nr:hypothetical protein [Bacteroidota bacterium]